MPQRDLIGEQQLNQVLKTITDRHPSINTKRFQTLNKGEIKQITIDEPIKIGVFTAHPSQVKDESSVLYYESNQFNKETTVFKIIVKELPTYIAIDPYGTPSDENLTDNLVQL